MCLFSIYYAPEPVLSGIYLKLIGIMQICKGCFIENINKAGSFGYVEFLIRELIFFRDMIAVLYCVAFFNSCYKFVISCLAQGTLYILLIPVENHMFVILCKQFPFGIFSPARFRPSGIA